MCISSPQCLGRETSTCGVLRCSGGSACFGGAVSYVADFQRRSITMAEVSQSMVTRTQVSHPRPTNTLHSTGSVVRPPEQALSRHRPYCQCRAQQQHDGLPLLITAVPTLFSTWRHPDRIPLLSALLPLSRLRSGIPPHRHCARARWSPEGPFLSPSLSPSPSLLSSPSPQSATAPRSDSSPTHRPTLTSSPARVAIESDDRFRRFGLGR
ncbi:hypothetical protein IWX49DRAFT_269300 [Phyllosticta citricarpa]